MDRRTVPTLDHGPTMLSTDKLASLPELAVEFAVDVYFAVYFLSSQNVAFVYDAACRASMFVRFRFHHSLPHVHDHDGHDDCGAGTSHSLLWVLCNAEPPGIALAAVVVVVWVESVEAAGETLQRVLAGAESTDIELGLRVVVAGLIADYVSDSFYLWWIARPHSPSDEASARPTCDVSSRVSYLSRCPCVSCQRSSSELRASY